MFYGCSNLQTIYCGDDWTNLEYLEESYEMFEGCEKLQGYRGTTYDEEYTDITYAKLDGMGSEPGYFSPVKEIYTIYNPDSKTLTYVYDAGRVVFGGEKYDPSGNRFIGFNEDVEFIVIDPSMKKAPQTDLTFLFCGHDKENKKYLPLSNVTLISYLENLNTSVVTDMSYMFSGMSSIQVLHLEDFDMSHVEYMDYMFEDCSSLNTIYTQKDWTIYGGSSANMFEGCENLVGGQGTEYDDAYTNGEYACPDGFRGKKGYFTAVKELYTAWEYSTGVLTYYFDIQRYAHGDNVVTEVYDCNDPKWPRFETAGGYNYSESVYSIEIDPSLDVIVNFPSLKSMFYGGPNHLLTNAYYIEGLEYLHTENVSDMSYMFAGMESLEYLDITHFDFSR